MQSHFATLWLPIMVALEVLNESLSIRHLVRGSRLLGGIPTNLYLSVSTVTVPSWRRGFLPRRGFFSWRVEYVSSEHYCQAEVFCSGYMQIVEPLQSLQHWSRHQHLYWMTINIINGNRKKHQSFLLRGIGSGPGPSSPPLIVLPFLTWWLRSPILIPGVKLAYHY